MAWEMQQKSMETFSETKARSEDELPKATTVFFVNKAQSDPEFRWEDLRLKSEELLQ